MNTRLEDVLMSSNKDGMVDFVQSNENVFPELVQLALLDKKPFSQRAAFILVACMNDNDHRVRKEMKFILEALPLKPDGQQRDLLRVVQRMELSEEQEGALFSISVDIWEKLGKKPATRYHAFHTMLKVAEKYPELVNEIKILASEEYTESLSPGIRHSLQRKIDKLL